MLDPTVLAGLLSLLAHDLRSPLTALQSNLDYVSREVGEIGHDAREALVDGLLSCDAFSHLIENCDLVALSLAGQDKLPLTPVSVRALLDEVTTRCSALAASYRQAIVLDAAADGSSLRVMSEISMAERALSNLVRNSVQHSPAESTLVLSAQPSKDTVEIQVRDQGPAVPTELRETIFTAEGQLSSKLQRNRYGRGLGLYCAQIAADLCGASVGILDRPDASNTFVLRLPLAA